MTLVITDGEFWWAGVSAFCYLNLCFLIVFYFWIFLRVQKRVQKKMVFMQLRIQFQINTLLTSKLYASGNSEFKQDDCNYMIKKGL
ncbi:TPA: hypothetical protein MIX23_28610 [Klebsiella pneumoniae]|nr:hypothetical protein APT85_16120 [Klebsiella pneumoniae]HBY5268699.1 hypothetical protein [Klebsiella pneumoniae]HBY5271186.1 hypothetical protein [Klebsiella pneumoniae]